MVPLTGTLSLLENTTCHTVTINDDEAVEPPETFTISITPVGPTQEFLNLFNVTVAETVVQIIDNDSEFSIAFKSKRTTKYCRFRADCFHT